jgi:hydroxymethylpyrimidine pyrophosphatase-like HAD family hydrolase
LICVDGCVVVCAKSERVLRHSALPPALLTGLVDLLERAGLACFVLGHGTVHACRDTVARHGYLHGWSQAIATHADMHGALDACEQALMLLGLGDAAQVAAALREVRPFEDRLDIDSFAVADARIIRFVLKGTSKGSALSTLAQELRIPREQIAAVGDWYNDLSMFAAAAHAYAMPRAPALVRANASHVLSADACRQGLIAAVLEHWLGHST